MTRIKDQESRIKDRVKAQGSDQGSKIGSRNKDQRSDQGSRIKDRGSRIKIKDKDQGHCTTMNEHPRRATEVILRQSKAPIELINPGSVP